MKPGALATDNMRLVSQPARKNVEPVVTRIEEIEEPAALSTFSIPPRISSMALATENPMSQFQQAWALAADDTKMQRRMVRTVVEHAMKDAGLKPYLYEIVKQMITDPDMGL
jgi:hypothetical protein